MSTTDIEVYCDEPSHNGKRQLVYRFMLDEEDGRRVWIRGESRVQPGIVGRKIPGFNSAAGILVGDRYVTRAERDADKTLIQRELIRRRYELECGFCGFKRVFRRETIESVLDALGAAGVSSISLKALAATVDREHGGAHH